MKKLFYSLFILVILLPCETFGQKSSIYNNESYYDWEVSCMIRKDKFKFILPKAMRQNDVDMWIIIDKGRGTEPLFQDLGAPTSNGNGLFIFTDRGNIGIEKVLFGGETEMSEACGAYDIIGYQGTLREFVSKRNPKRIGVNMSSAKELMPMEGRHLADGISHIDYINLKNELGEPYASRLVSAEGVIADFRGERVASEIIEFSKIADVTRKLEERALSNEVITPGKTTINDMQWWMENQRKAKGLKRGWFPTVYISDPSNVEISRAAYVIQRGDIVQIDWGIGRNNFFTDIKRFAYVLKEGEKDVPEYVNNAFFEAMKIRNLIQSNVTSGKTGREQLDNLKRLVNEAGYVYTESERPGKSKGIEVNIGMHGAGNLGHEIGASIFEVYPIRTTYTVPQNTIISVEYIVFTPEKEWGGNKIPVNIEENALITDHGIEWLYPPQNKVLIIR